MDILHANPNYSRAKNSTLSDVGNVPSMTVLFARFEGGCKVVRIALHFNSCSSFSADIDDILEVAFRLILTTDMALFTVHTPSMTHFN